MNEEQENEVKRHGVECCSKGVRLFKGLGEEGFGEHDGKFTIIWLLLSFSKKKENIKEREAKQNPN